MSSICERGGTLIASASGDIVAWIPLGEDEWREITWKRKPEPTLHVAHISDTKEEIANFIQKNHVGWTMRKVNLSGVAVDKNNVIVNPRETNDDQFE